MGKVLGSQFMPLRFPAEVLISRYRRFQELLRREGIDAAMIRTLSSFTYFTGTKWLRPALLVPAEGEPTAFIARGEEDFFRERTWVKNVVTFTEGGELMAKVSRTFRERGYKRVGLEFGLERDAYILFYEMFKKLNPKVEVVDVSKLIYELRTTKDKYELESIRRAGKVASKVMEHVLSIVKPGVSETEIAAEAYYKLYSSGCEEPHVHVNVGPAPRVHSEPFRDVKVREGVFVTVIIGADYNRYYANMSRTIYVGRASGTAEKALKCMNEVYELASKLTKAGVRLIDVMKELDKVYAKYGLLDYRVVGYAHGVGLQVEEPPITTIVPQHRIVEVKPNMVLAFVHAPLLLKGLGQVKVEDTFIVREDGELEKVTT